MAGAPSILLVEDECMVAMLGEDVLIDAGYSVRLATTLKDALALAAAETFAAAVLDVQLDEGEDSFPVAEVLSARGIPFIFVTGYGKSGIRSDMAGHGCLQKPYRAEELVNLVAAAVAAPQRRGLASGG